jgi:hypothetical protein
MARQSATAAIGTSSQGIDRRMFTPVPCSAAAAEGKHAAARQALPARRQQQRQCNCGGGDAGKRAGGETYGVALLGAGTAA